MVRKKKETNRVDELLDELLEDCQGPEDILGDLGLMKQIKKRLVERALSGELNGHLKSEAALDAFAEKWDETYPAVSQVWIRNWENVIPIFNYPFAKRLRRS